MSALLVYHVVAGALVRKGRPDRPLDPASDWTDAEAWTDAAVWPEQPEGAP